MRQKYSFPCFMIISGVESRPKATMEGTKHENKEENAKKFRGFEQCTKAARG
jgi:hypothetical protein